MHTITANHFRQHLKWEVDRAVTNCEPLYINRKNGEDFIVIGAKEWQDIEATLHLNQITGMVTSIHKASKEPLKQGTKLKDVKW